MMLARRTCVAVWAAVAAIAVAIAGCGSPAAETAPLGAAPGGQTPGTAPAAPTGTTPRTAAALTGQEIAARSVAAYAGVETVRMDMKMTMDLNITGGEEPMAMTMAAEGTGAVKTATSEMMLALNMDMDIPGLSGQTASSDMYMTGGWLYQKTTAPGTGTQWTKMRLSDAAWPQMWAQQNQLAQQIEMLRTAVAVTNLGSERVDGIDCYVLQIEPDMAALAGWAMSQMPQQTDGAVASSADLGKMFKAFSVKEWISRKDFLPVKADMTLVIDVGADAATGTAGAPEKVAMSITAAMKYYGYNQPVSIELPAEAAGAREIPAGR